MTLSNLAKGKRKVVEDAHSESGSSSLSPVPETVRLPPKKRIRRAETRTCPICDEPIPLRLLRTHAELEAQRVEEIIKNIGSTSVLADTNDLEDSSRSRRSALKARKSLTTRSGNILSVVEQAGKTIQAIKRRRKQRHVKLRVMTKEEDEEGHGRDTLSRGIESGRVTCPVCLVLVRGDEDVIQAHVDACLADESRRLDEQRQQREDDHRSRSEGDMWGDILDVEGAGGHVGDVRGTGFHTRDPNEPDVDDEVDVDGDDKAFGEAQFTEGDILPITTLRPSESEGVDIREESEVETQESLRDLVADGKVASRRSPGEEGPEVVIENEEVMGVGDSDRLDLAVLAARKRKDKGALIAALDNKVKQLESLRVSSSLLCRICLDPYNEPTASTGCWHTCCRECWLRCLGSTKLCPICKRITSATDLRRIYL